MANVPGPNDRFAIFGRTGSGKTQSATWWLSNRDYDRRPWIVLNYKRDELIDSIPYSHDIDLNQLPESPGIYIAHPHPDDTDAVNDLLKHIWERGNIGLFVDEGYMIGQRSRWFRTILTQGRSLKIPVIINSQRPVYLDKFVMTESEYFQVFQLQHEDDIKSLRKIIRKDMQSLPDYHSYYYDVRKQLLFRTPPVPNEETILSTFEIRLRDRKVKI